MAELLQKSVRTLMKEEAGRQGVILKDSLLDQLIIQADLACPAKINVQAFMDKAVKLAGLAVKLLAVQKTPEYKGAAINV